MEFLTDIAQVNQIVTTLAGAAGTSAITSSAVDMAGYDGCLFIVVVGPVVSGATTSFKLQQSSDNAAADDYSDLADTSQTVADDADNTTFLVDVKRPEKRYLKLVVTRGAQNATIGGVLAIPYGKHSRGAALTAGTAITAAERFNFPLEGTA